MTFDPQVALAYARRFARPRLVGSDENQRVAGEIAALLQSWGYRITRETFEFSTAYNLFITLEVLACLLLALASLVGQAASPWASASLAIGIVAVMVAAPWLNRAAQAGASRSLDTTQHIDRWQRVCLRLGRRLSAANMIATLPGASDNAALPHLLLIAHNDSKSQRLPIVVRVACFALSIIGGMAYAAATLLYALTATPALGDLARLAAVVAMAAGIPLLFLDAGNASPGAIDNASGLGVTLHLAEILARRRDWQSRLRLTFLMTGAEEIGVAGAAAYVRRHLSALRDDARRAGLHILNFDGVGVDADLRLAGAHLNRRNNGRMAGWVAAAARDCGLRVKPFSMIGLSYDHVPFAEAGFDAVSLIAIGRATRAVHTPRDTADLLHPRGFAQAGAIALRIIEQIQAAR